MLENPKHERFAQELSKGKTAGEAYVNAGYKANDGNASTLKGNQKIADRVAELLERAAIRAEVTVESLIGEAEEVRVKALESGQFNAAIQAIKEKGVLSGRRIERAETGKPGDFSRMNDVELREFIAERAGRVGLGLARIGLAPGEDGTSESARRIN